MRFKLKYLATLALGALLTAAAQAAVAVDPQIITGYWCVTNNAPIVWSSLSSSDLIFVSPAQGPTSLTANNTFKAIPPQGYKLDKWAASREPGPYYDGLPPLVDFTPTKTSYEITLTEADFTSDMLRTDGTTYYSYLIPCFSWLKYRIEYDAKGGSPTPTTQSNNIYTNKVTLATTAITRKGYQFGGWSTTAKTFTPGVTVTGADLGATTSGVVRLAAKWQANTYKIVFNSNDGANQTTEQTLTYDVAAKLTANTFTRAGYTFAGWADAADSTTIRYADEASVKNLTETQGETIALYAVWQANQYTITFDMNDGSDAPLTTSMPISYGVPTALTATAFTRTGYTFAGWATTRDGAVVYGNAETITYTQTADSTLYAVWEPITYYISFNKNAANAEGSMSDNGMTCRYDVDYTLSPNAFVYAGQTFLGWSRDPSAQTAEYGDKGSVRNLTATDGQTVQLYAVWQATRYTVKFDRQDGSAVTEHAYTYSDSLTLETPTRTGYTFLGWQLGEVTYAAGIELKIAELPFEAGALTFTAQWQANQYTLHFDANGGEGTMPDQTLTFDTPFTLPANAFTRDKHNFLNWTNAVGTVYADKAEVLNLSTAEDVTLYAVWEDVSWAYDADLYAALDLAQSTDYKLRAENWVVTNKVNKTSKPTDVPAKGETCLFATLATHGDCVFEMQILTKGTLTFSWRANTVNNNGYSFSIQTNDVSVFNERNPTFETWQSQTIEVTSVPMLLKCHLSITTFGGFAYLDNFQWQAAGAADEPTEADIPVLKPATSSTGFGISFESDARFDYRLYGSDDLMRPFAEWTSIGAPQPGTGEAINFDNLIQADAPTYFYRVRVIPKQTN